MAISPQGMANFEYWNRLPMGISNYGGDTQVYTVQDYSTPLFTVYNQQAMASLATPMTGECIIPQVQVDPDLVDKLADAMWQPVIKDLAESNMGSIAGTIQSTKTRLNSLLQTQGISDEDKRKVQALLERLDEQERKFRELQNSEGLTNDEVYDRSKEIERAMREITAETSQLNITPQRSNQSQSSENEPQGAGSQQSQEMQELTQQLQQLQQQLENLQGQNTGNQQQAAEQSQGFFVAPEYAQGRAELEEKMQQEIDAQTGGVRSAAFMAQEFRDAINYTNWLGIAGTDDEKFNNICSQINKDNVMDLMLAYNRFQSSEDGESFMEAFMYDADGEQKPKYGKQIANALKEKAIEVGVYDECKDDFAIIYDELGDFSIDNTIYENFDNIIEKIAVAMGQPEYARPYKN